MNCKQCGQSIGLDELGRWDHTELPEGVRVRHFAMPEASRHAERVNMLESWLIDRRSEDMKRFEQMAAQIAAMAEQITAMIERLNAIEEKFRLVSWSREGWQDLMRG